MNIGKLIIDNQSKVGYYELVNWKTNDYIVGSDITAYGWGLICGINPTPLIKLNGGC